MSAGELILTTKLVKAEFVLERNGTDAFDNSGASVDAQLGPSWWHGYFAVERCNMAEARLWSAWGDRRIEHGHTFTAFRLFRARPQGLLGNADGALTIDVDPETFAVEVGGVGLGQVRIGDMISYRTPNNGFCCVQAQADANPTAGAVSFVVTPRPMAAHGTPAVRRVQALAEFRLATPLPPFEDMIDRRFEFEATQVIR